MIEVDEVVGRYARRAVALFPRRFGLVAVGGVCWFWLCVLVANYSRKALVVELLGVTPAYFFYVLGIWLWVPLGMVFAIRATVRGDQSLRTAVVQSGLGAAALFISAWTVGKGIVELI